MRVALLLLAVACGAPESPSAPAEAPVAAPAPAPAAPPQAPAAAAAAALRVGAPAPDVTLTLHDGRQVALSSLRGKHVLVYFYPKDDTPGCTTEAVGLRDGWADVVAAGLEVFGVSTQDAASHQAFIDKHQLPFPLVVDADEAVARAFGVPVSHGFADRQTFLIAPDGTIKATWPDVDPATHTADVLAAARG